MKRWAALTVLLYMVALAALTVPVSLLAFGQWWLQPGSAATVSSVLTLYTESGYWIWLGVLGLGHALLLLVPVGVAERRPVPRRRLLVPIATTGFFLANLFLAGVFCILCAIFEDKAFEVFAFVGDLVRTDAARNPLHQDLWNHPTLTGSPSFDYFLGLAFVVVLLWLAWAVVFYRVAGKDDPASLTRRCTRWLLRGSVLELLVAVPTHIIVRHRGDCCAPIGTFWGITTGLALMLLCFGPGVFFLFVERARRLRAKREGTVVEGLKG